MVRNHSVIWISLFLIGAMLRVVNINQPVNTTSWRESDLASVARNFYRGNMNILYPQIDWRGTGPGYVEMEFPIMPWLMAAGYKIVGQNEIIGRLLSYLFSLLSLLLFFKIANELLKPPGSYFASLFFVFSPLLIEISTAIQPESLMLLFDLAAIYFFIYWIKNEKFKYLLIACIFTALAMLAKISNGFLGLFFLFVLIQKQGPRFLKDYKIYLAGFITLVPPLLWYAHAKGIYNAYGNSLGLSNEYHWIGFDFFTNPYFVKGLFLNEIYYALVPVGFVLILYALFSKKIRLKPTGKYAFFLITAVYIYYIVGIRTTADRWSIYYHFVSVPPTALIIGLSLNYLKKINNSSHAIKLVWGTIIISLLLALAARFKLSNEYSSSKPELVVTGLGVMLILGIAFLLMLNRKKIIFHGIEKINLTTLVIVFLVLTTLLYQVKKIEDYYSGTSESVYYSSRMQLAELIPENSLILCSGGTCVDPTGYNVAYNASYFFYWLDRKGFNICTQNQTIENVENYKNMGASYFLAEKGVLDRVPGFEKQLRKKYHLIYDQNEIMLFNLTNSLTQATTYDFKKSVLCHKKMNN